MECAHAWMIATLVADAAASALPCCRHLVALAPSLPALEGFVCGPMLQAAICSLVQVRTSYMLRTLLQTYKSM